MPPRTIAKVSLALVLVLIASLSTVRVRQAWGEQQARTSSDSAQHQVTSALVRGASVGLLPSELAPFNRQWRTLSGTPRPSSSLFWGSQETFYDRQATEYRRLAGKINRVIEAVGRRTRSEAISVLAALDADIGRARSYEIDTSSAHMQLTEQRKKLAAASSPRAFRQIATKAGAIRNTLSAAVMIRAKYVSSVLASSGNTTSGVQSAADSETTAAQNQLTLVGLLSPQATKLSAQLTTTNSAVHAQTSAFNAAVKEAALHDLVSQISAFYARTVPSTLIVVSTEDQSARMYDHGSQVYQTAVTTGGPELPTDHGVFHIYEKISPFVFHSPWPEGSPYYYPPTPIDFWMPFDGAQGLHDASWRSNFGPGSNFAPTDLGTGNYILGTHGCVNLPYDAASFVWNWAPVGTTVVVV